MIFYRAGRQFSDGSLVYSPCKHGHPRRQKEQAPFCTSPRLLQNPCGGVAQLTLRPQYVPDSPNPPRFCCLHFLQGQNTLQRNHSSHSFLAFRARHSPPIFFPPVPTGFAHPLGTGCLPSPPHFLVPGRSAGIDPSCFPPSPGWFISTWGRDRPDPYPQFRLPRLDMLSF